MPCLEFVNLPKIRNLPIVDLQAVLEGDSSAASDFQARTQKLDVEGRTDGLHSVHCVSIPVLGAIPAGFGEPAEPVDMGSIPVDLEALGIRPDSRIFALKVRGDSMVDAHILDEDFVILEAREPKIGDIVAALIDGETTLKRFVVEEGDLFLRAENSRYPKLIPIEELVIQGVVRAVVRICERPRVMR